MFASPMSFQQIPQTQTQTSNTKWYVAGGLVLLGLIIGVVVYLIKKKRKTPPTPDTQAPVTPFVPVIQTTQPRFCAEGTAGTLCDKTVANWCNNNATRIYSAGSNLGMKTRDEDRSGPPVCVCKPGFAGEQCEKTLADLCSQGNTESVETERDLNNVSRTKCKCKSGFAGERCDETIAKYCNDRATAFRAGQGGVCDCNAPYSGQRCENSNEVKCQAGKAPCEQITFISPELAVYKDTTTGNFRAEYVDTKCKGPYWSPMITCKKLGKSFTETSCQGTDIAEYRFVCRSNLRK